MEFVVVLVVFVLAMIGLTRPYIGLLALLIVMDLDPGELYPQLAPLHLERVTASLLLIAFLVNGGKFRFPKPTRWFLAFYGAMIVSIPLAFWRANSVASCIWFLETVALVLFITALLTTEERIRWFLLTYVVLVDWLGGSALWNYEHGIWLVTMHIERAIGITNSAGDPDSLAITLLLTIPLCLALMVRSNPMWMRVVAAASIGVYLVTIVDTGSRAAASGVLFLILLVLFRKPKNLFFLPVLVALAPLVWIVIPQQYKARYETVDHLKSDESYQNRILSWEGGIAMFESNPITGIGPGNYTDANGEKYWPGNGRKTFLNAHSLYFKLLGELGLIGVFTFGGYLICVFRLNFRVRKELLAHETSSFLRTLPAMFNIILCLLLFDGYAAHNLYRDNWYIVGAMVACVSLLPVLQQEVTVKVPGQPEIAGSTAAVPEWSPALLPVLRRQVPTEAPPA
ncbi:MAG TPA: O-antigen ligase family protein [Acidobacteriaceae bacterium]|nr:O-antigen ligase family protein [Acidobacteriaceae bacterium]